MKKIIRLTESDLTRIVKKIITESNLINENLKFLNGETAPEDPRNIKYPKYEIPGTFRILSVFRSSLSDKLAELVDELKKTQEGVQIWKKYVQKLVYFENRLYNAVSDLKKNPKRYGLGSNEKYKSATNWPQLVKKYNGEYIEKTIDEIEAVINMMINEYRKSNNTQKENTVKNDLKVGGEYVYTNKEGVKKEVKLISTKSKMKAGPDKEWATNDDIDVENLADDYVFVAFKNKKGTFNTSSPTLAVLKSRLEIKK